MRHCYLLNSSTSGWARVLGVRNNPFGWPSAAATTAASLTTPSSTARWKTWNKEDEDQREVDEGGTLSVLHIYMQMPSP